MSSSIITQVSFQKSLKYTDVAALCVVGKLFHLLYPLAGLSSLMLTGISTVFNRKRTWHSRDFQRQFLLWSTTWIVLDGRRKIKTEDQHFQICAAAEFHAVVVRLAVHVFPHFTGQTVANVFTTKNKAIRVLVNSRKYFHKWIVYKQDIHNDLYY